MNGKASSAWFGVLSDMKGDARPPQLSLELVLVVLLLGMCHSIGLAGEQLGRQPKTLDLQNRPIRRSGLTL